MGAVEEVRRGGGVEEDGKEEVGVMVMRERRREREREKYY